MGNESFIWDWLTYDWLNQNMRTIILVLIIAIIILFLFPVLLGYDLKKESDKKLNKDKIE